MRIEKPFISHAKQTERDEMVAWFAQNEGLRHADTTPRGTIWYSGPRWVMALAYGNGDWLHHYKIVIWDSELALQFALRFGQSSYSGRSEVGEADEIQVYDAMLDERSQWTHSIRDYLRQH